MSHNQIHCECCGSVRSVQTYFDRHGDPEQLCESCREQDLALAEVPRVQHADKIAAAVLWVAFAVILISTFGCATRPHTVSSVEVNGRQVAVHTDPPPALVPAICGDNWAGCYDAILDRILLRSPVSGQTVEHEKAHAAGMVHGYWFRNDVHGWMCTNVLISGGRYKAGQVICLRGRDEDVFTDSTLTRLEEQA